LKAARRWLSNTGNYTRKRAKKCLDSAAKDEALLESIEKAAEEAEKMLSAA